MRSLVWFFLSACAMLAQDGAALYKQHCATWHDAPAARVPPFSALRDMSLPRILRSLESGTMQTQAAGLNNAERYAVASYLGTPAIVKPAPPASAFCSASPGTLADPRRGPSWMGWGLNPANTRFQGAEAAGLTPESVPRLKLKWAFGLGDVTIARSQTAVAAGRVFVGSQTGAVYSLNARTGCMHWTFEADAPVRTAIVIGTAGEPARPAAFFGDQKANAYAVDAATGALLWKVHVEDHFAALITGAPLFHAGVLYVPVASFEEAMPSLPTYECCTFRGSVVALDTAAGKRVWKTYTIAELPHALKATGLRQAVQWLKTTAKMYGPSGAAVWSTPTFDEKRDALYVATGDNYSDPATATSDAVLALDRKSGQLLWSKQMTPGDAYNTGCDTPRKTNCPDAPGPDADFGQPPILVSLANGRRALVIGQKSGMAHALDPDKQGKILWQTRVGKGGMLGGSQWGSAADGENMYVAISDLQISGVTPDSSSAQGYRLELAPDKGGGLYALRVATGAQVWSAKSAPCGVRKRCSPAQSAAVTGIAGVVFLGSMDGHLRAYSVIDGKVLWDVDTARDYTTVNGAKANGGSMDGSGPVIAGGMLYVNSGYGQWGGMPGNVLLAFSVEGK